MQYSRYVGIVVPFIAGIALLGATSFASAEVSSTTEASAAAHSQTTAASTSSQQNVVEIGSKGNVLLRGTVEVVGSGSITVKSWGGSWTVLVGSSATVLPHETSLNDLSDVKIGDFVGVQGVINTGAVWTVDAKLVRDWTGNQTIHQEMKTNAQTVHAIEKNGHDTGIGRIFEGVAGSVTGTTFILTGAASGTTYTVNLLTDTKLVDRGYRTVSSLSLIQTNDHIRVYGTANETVITPQVVRDTSLPR
jgi:hypothetical protein